MDQAKELKQKCPLGINELMWIVYVAYDAHEMSSYFPWKKLECRPLQNCLALIVSLIDSLLVCESSFFFFFFFFFFCYFRNTSNYADDVLREKKKTNKRLEKK